MKAVVHAVEDGRRGLPVREEPLEKRITLSASEMPLDEELDCSR